VPISSEWPKIFLLENFEALRFQIYCEISKEIPIFSEWPKIILLKNFEALRNAHKYCEIPKEIPISSE